MKIRLNRILSPSLRTFGFSLAALVASHSAHAASASWLGTTDATWSGTGNWSATPVPGSGDTATFFGLGNGNTTVDLGAGVTIGTVAIDTGTSYTIGSGGAGAQTLTFNSATGSNAVTMTGTVATNQTINANIVNNTADSTLRFVNSSTAGAVLTINGAITSGTGTAARTVNSSGVGNVVFNGAVTPGSATSVAVANTSTGTLTFGGSGTSSLSTLRATAGGSIVINGQNVTVASSSSFGASSNFGKFFLTSGVVAFNGGLTNNSNSGDGTGFIVNGGTFSASSIFLNRTNNFSTTSGAISGTAQNWGTSGFQVNGGVATVTGAVNLAGSNSAANGQVSGSGNLTIGGELILGSGANTRTTLFQVTGGTLTNTDTVGGGIVIGKGSASNASSGELLLTGGVTTTEKITFGLSGGLAGSFGNLTMNGANATLYVGSGGIAKASTNAFTDSINLTSGILAAKANWSSTMNMNLNGVTSGTAFNIKAADASNVAKNITLNGVLSGTGGFTKTGGGTLTLGNTNTYSGATVVSAGTLLVNGFISSAATVNGGVFAGTGTTGSVTVATAGTLAAGNSGIGTLTTGAVSLSGTSTFAVDINTATQASDSLLSGNFSLDAANSVKLVLTDLGGDVHMALGTTFTVVQYSGVWDTHLFSFNGSALADDSIFSFGSNNYQISYDGVGGGGNSVTLTTVVPEPSTVALIGVGLAGVLWRSRRGRATGSRA